MPAERRPRMRWMVTLLGVVVGAAALLSGSRRRPQAAGHPGEAPPASVIAIGVETRDMDLRGTILTLAVWTVFVVVGIGAVFATIGYFGASRQRAQPQAGAPKTAAVAPGPRLQTEPYQDLAALRANEDSRLGHYAWLDAAHSRARIPIGDAMKLMAGRTLDAAP